MNLKRRKVWQTETTAHKDSSNISHYNRGEHTVLTKQQSHSQSGYFLKICAWPIYKNAAKNVKIDSEKLYIMRCKKIDQERNIGQN